MRWIGLAVALICASPAAAGADPSPLEWLLKADKTGTEVRPKAKAKIRWRVGGVPIADTSIEWDQTFARLKHPDRKQVRVFVRGRHVALAAFISIDDLWPVAGRPALVHPRPKALAVAPRPDSPGVHLDAGAPVSIAKRAGRTVRVRVRHPVISADGSIQASALDVEFSPRTGTEPAHDYEWVVGAVALRDRPNGAVVARLKPGEDSGPSVAVRRLADRGAHTLIAYDGVWATAVGWVRTTDLEPGSDSGVGYGTGRGGGPRVRLVRGTILRDAVDGVRVGVVIKTAPFLRRGKSGKWTQIEAESDVGDVYLWTSDERMTIAGGE